MNKDSKALSTNEEIRQIIKKDFPYGIFQDGETRNVVIFNRDYKVITYAGKKEFDFDPDELSDIFTSIQDHKFLFLEDGSVYVGKMFWLYTDLTSPTCLDKKNLSKYLFKYTRLMEHVLGQVENTYDKYHKVTSEQKQIYESKFKMLYPESK